MIETDDSGEEPLMPLYATDEGGDATMSSDTAAIQKRAMKKKTRASLTVPERVAAMRELEAQSRISEARVRAQLPSALVTPEVGSLAYTTEVKSIEALLEQFPVNVPEARKISAAARKKKETTVDKAELIQAVEELILSMQKVRLFDGDLKRDLDAKETEQRFRQGSLSVPVLTAQHFRQLCRVGGTFTVGGNKVTYASCRRADACYAATGPIRGNILPGQKRPILRAYYDEDDDKRRFASRDCVVCILHRFNKFIRMVKTYDTATLVLEVPLLMPFGVEVDTIGGFHSSYTARVDKKRWEGFADPFPFDDVSVWMWERLPDPTAEGGATWAINTEAIFYQPDTNTRPYDVVLGPRRSKHCIRFSVGDLPRSTPLVCDFCHDTPAAFLWMNVKEKFYVCDACYRKRVDSDADWCTREKFEDCPLLNTVVQEGMEEQLIRSARSSLVPMTSTAHIKGRSSATTVAFFDMKARDFVARSIKRTTKAEAAADAKALTAASTAAKPPALIAAHMARVMPPPDPKPYLNAIKMKEQTLVARIANSLGAPTVLVDDLFVSSPSASAAAAATSSRTMPPPTGPPSWLCVNCRAKMSGMRARCTICQTPKGAVMKPPVAAAVKVKPEPVVNTPAAASPLLPNFHNASSIPQSVTNTSNVDLTIEYMSILEAEYKKKIRGRNPKAEKRDKQTDREASIQANNIIYALAPQMLRARRRSGRHVEWILANLSAVNTEIGRWASYEPFVALMLPFSIPPDPSTETKPKDAKPADVNTYRSIYYNEFCESCKTQFLEEPAWVTVVCYLLKGDSETPIEDCEQFLRARLPLREFPHVLRWAMLERLTFEIRQRSVVVAKKIINCTPIEQFDYGVMSSTRPEPVQRPEREGLENERAGLRLAMFHALQVQDCYWKLVFRLRDLMRQQQYARLFAASDADSPSEINIHWTSEDPINELTIPYLAVIDPVYTRRMEENKKTPVQKSMSKVDAGKSTGRMANDNNAPVVRWDWRLRDFQISMIICGLLGNYSHLDVSDHPSLELRYNLYRRWAAVRGREDAPWMFFYWLITNLYQLVKHTSQQYLCYRVRHVLSLVEHCRGLYDFDSFLLGADDLVRTMRSYIDANRIVFGMWDVTSDFVPVRFVETMQPLVVQIKKLSSEFMLDHIYTAKKREFLKALRACVKSYPSANYADLQPSLEGAVYEPADRKTSASDWGLKQSHFELIRRVVRAGYRQDRQPELKLVKVLPLFQCPPAAVELVTEMMFCHYKGGKINKGCQALRAEYPYTYNLCQAFAFFWLREQIVQIHPLPLHHKEAQIEAALARTRRLFPNSNAIALEHATITMCPSCLRHSSFIRDNGPKVKRGAERGTLNARANFHPAQERIRLFCSDQQEFAEESCEHTEQVRIPIIGYMVEIRGQLITACAGKSCKCGIPSTINPARCAYQARTFLCEDDTIVQMAMHAEMKRSKRLITGQHKFVEMPFLDQARSNSLDNVSTILGSDDDTDEDEEPSADGTIRALPVTTKKARLSVEIRCDLCPGHPIITSAKKLSINAYALNACTKHHLDDMPHELKERKLASVKSDVCTKLGGCICSDLKSTCTGEWNRESIIAVARLVDGRSQSSSIRQARKHKIEAKKTAAAPRRRRNAFNSKK